MTVDSYAFNENNSDGDSRDYLIEDIRDISTPKIINTMRALVKDGATPIEILRLTLKHFSKHDVSLWDNPASKVSWQIMLFFGYVFCISPVKFKSVRGWYGFGSGVLTDEDINESLQEAFCSNISEWEGLIAGPSDEDDDEEDDLQN